MTEFISKIQYRNFETGEFTDSRKRSFPELIKLLEVFQWDKEREHILIDLTNPSITIEGANNDFLKLAVFYNGRFALYYFDNKNVLYTKSFSQVKDSYPFIENIFVQANFDTSAFKKENTWLQRNRKHFVSQSFDYTVTPASGARYLWLTIRKYFIIAFAFIVAELLFSKNLQLLLVFKIVLFMLSVPSLLNTLLFLNNYKYAKGKRFIMTKGKEAFYYGYEEAPLQYYKKNISSFTVITGGGPIYGDRNTFSFTGDFSFIIIHMNDGNNVVIPSVLVDSLKLSQKLYAYNRIVQRGFPWL